MLVLICFSLIWISSLISLSVQHLTVTCLPDLMPFMTHFWLVLVFLFYNAFYNKMPERMVWLFIMTVQFFHYILLKVTFSLPGLIANSRSSIHWLSLVTCCYLPLQFSLPQHTHHFLVFFFFIAYFLCICVCGCGCAEFCQMHFLHQLITSYDFLP